MESFRSGYAAGRLWAAVRKEARAMNIAVQDPPKKRKTAAGEGDIKEEEEGKGEKKGTKQTKQRGQDEE